MKLQLRAATSVQSTKRGQILTIEARSGERETSPEPRGSLYGAQQNRLKIAERQSKLLA